MKFFGRRKAETRGATIETETVPVSAENFLAFFGVNAANLPHVTIDTALQVPAVAAAVAFLSRTLATLPLHAYRRTKSGPERISGRLEVVVHEAANPTMGSFKFRQYFWQQVFTGGRGLAWIERTPQGIAALWPLDPARTTVKRSAWLTTYEVDGKAYSAEDVIDVPFMLKSDLLSHYGPITLASKAIQLALAMNDYGSQFFAGGGVPPLALEGPLPQGAEAMKRAMGDIHRAIDAAKKESKPIFPMPPGHKLTQVGYDPAKGQMIEARRFQVEEIARAYQLPPVFLQDLTRATFSNAEQQDLHLVKHLIGQWAQALEDEMNLKIFGQMNGGRYVEHNLDGLMRGDFKSRIDGIARGIQAGFLTPNEGRHLENRPNHPNPAADDLFMQGATVVLGSQPTNNGGSNGDSGNQGNGQAA
ncbi:MAG: phage portal protein [Pararhizobium sp.]